MKAAYEPLTDAEWALVEAIFSDDARQTTLKPRTDARACADAVLHVLTIKRGWHRGALPQDMRYPSMATVYRRYIEWKNGGALAKAIAILTDTRAFEERQRGSKATPKPERASFCFGAAEILAAMQSAARARLMEGKPATWKCEVIDECTAA